MNVFGNGIDIVECSRFERLIQKRSFRNGIYTEREQRYINSKKINKSQSAAGIFCAKEAFLKSCGVGIFSVKLTEIEVGHDERGKPRISLLGGAKERFSDLDFELSISHCKEYAVASVIAFSKLCVRTDQYEACRFGSNV